MKPIAKINRNKDAFTIVELLTVMAVIIILFGLLAPAVNRVKRFARRVAQKSQLHSIEVALDLFNAENGDYPPSGRLEVGGTNKYCGAMKLCEALMGQDLLGFHSSSLFSTSDWGNYYNGQPGVRVMKGPSLELDTANVHDINDVYGSSVTVAAGYTQIPNYYVLCDVYTFGGKAGMPILYYKANRANYPSSNIFNYSDNQDLVELGTVTPPATETWFTTVGSNGLTGFQTLIVDSTINLPNWPHRADTYILQSAGFDGQFGPAVDALGNVVPDKCDDIFNFTN